MKSKLQQQLCNGVRALTFVPNSTCTQRKQKTICSTYFCHSIRALRSHSIWRNFQTIPTSVMSVDGDGKTGRVSSCPVGYFYFLFLGCSCVEVNRCISIDKPGEYSPTIFASRFLCMCPFPSRTIFPSPISLYACIDGVHFREKER